MLEKVTSVSQQAQAVDLLIYYLEKMFDRLEDKVIYR